MQGLVNFADQCALVLAVFLPAFCYCAAIGWFGFGAWGLWQQSQPHNPFRGKPWVPIFSILLSGVASAFDKILTKANASGGSSVTVGMAGDLTSYTSGTVNTTLLGNTPGDAILNITDIFALFFQCFGAWCCFLALMSWRATINGQSNRSRMGCGVQFVFGVILINPHTVMQWLVTQLSLQS